MEKAIKDDAQVSVNKGNQENTLLSLKEVVELINQNTSLEIDGKNAEVSLKREGLKIALIYARFCVFYYDEENKDGTYRVRWWLDYVNDYNVEDVFDIVDELNNVASLLERNGVRIEEIVDN
jgi:hypothetical protein